MKITGLKPRTANNSANYKWTFEFNMPSTEYICIQAFRDDSFLCYEAGKEDPQLITIKSTIENKAIMSGFYKE